MNKNEIYEKLKTEFSNSGPLKLGAIESWAKANIGEDVKIYSLIQQAKVGRNQYDFRTSEKPILVTGPKNDQSFTSNTTAQKIQVLSSNSESYVPQKDPMFVGHGFYRRMVKVFKSKLFYPIFVTGLSGNGKTFMVEQAAASLGREMIRINITTESDEAALLGGFRLINGETVYQDGPVVIAMRRGAIALLDEIDLGSNKMMCLQPILEGKPFLNKHTGEVVFPAEGFNVIATANTKGKGSDDGRFIGTNVMNEAFLERFPITVEQSYPTKSIETKILTNHFEMLSMNDESEFIGHLINWADIIRKTFYDGGIDELITTRRLTHIAKAYSIFGNKLEALTFCVNRFDDETKSGFIDLYSKIDAGVDVEEFEKKEGTFEL